MEHAERYYPMSGIRIRPLNAVFWTAFILSIISNPIAGLLWDKWLAVMFVYLLRDFWVLLSPVMLLILAVNGRSLLLTCALFLGLVHFFISYSFISDAQPSVDVLFLQYRNTFGFLLAWGFAMMPFGGLSAERVAKICTYTGLFFVIYCFAEFFSMLRFGVEFANAFFNKTLLESVKGTKANLDAGVLGALRVPGPLFSPSQLGIMLAYLYFVTRVTVGGSKSIVLGCLIVMVEVLAVSKTGIAMILLAEGMILTSRRWAYPALLAVLAGPLLADMLLFPFLDRYHTASAAFHFAGYISGLHGLLIHPFGIGIGNAGTLAATLQDLNLRFGNESGLATIFGNLGLIGVIMLLLTMMQMGIQKQADYIRFFVLYIASIAFNENALSPYLFVIPLTLLVAFHRSDAYRMRRFQKNVERLAE